MFAPQSRTFISRAKPGLISRFTQRAKSGLFSVTQKAKPRLIPSYISNGTSSVTIKHRNNSTMPKINASFIKQINSLNEVQSVDKVAEIFSHGKSLEELKPTEGKPIFVLLVGSPGVGKTTWLRKRDTKNVIGYSLDNFYQVSLDSLVENIKPYRNATKLLHNTMRQKYGHKHKGNNTYNEDLSNNDYQLLSQPYLRTIMSKESNFSLPVTVNALTRKILEQSNESKSKSKSKSKDICNNLTGCLKAGLQYGIDNGLNIIYDTTITGKKIRLDELMQSLHNYTVKAVLIEASHEQIREQMQTRHKNMISKDKFLRAVPPALIQRFIDDNREGFEEIKKIANVETIEVHK